MPDIKIIPQKGLSRDFVLSLFFNYQQANHLYAHLYEHLFFRSLDDKCKKNGKVGSGILKVAVGNKVEPEFLSDVLLLRRISVEDIVAEKKRIVLEALSSIGGHRWLIHNLIQYQQKNKSSLLRHLKLVERNLSFSKKDEILKNIKLTHSIIYAPTSLAKELKMLIYTVANRFGKGKIENKDTMIDDIYSYPREKLIYPAYSIKVPIHSVIDAYKLVFISRIIKEEVEKKIRQEGISYSCQLEMNKDFTPQIFSTFFSLVDSKDCQSFLDVVEKVAKNPPRNRYVFEATRQKLIQELEEKNKNIVIKLEDKIIQKLEWETTNILSMSEKIALVKKASLKEIYNWWSHRIARSSKITLFY
jgi:hypothetical protein